MAAARAQVVIVQAHRDHAVIALAVGLLGRLKLQCPVRDLFLITREAALALEDALIPVGRVGADELQVCELDQNDEHSAGCPSIRTNPARQTP